MEEISEGEEKLFHADVVVLATGFKKPSIDFLPQDLFPEGYEVLEDLFKYSPWLNLIL